MTVPEALLRDIQQALGRRDGAAAVHLIDEALGQAPGDIDLRLQKAMALRLQGDLKGALAALDATLDLEPYHFVALLSKAAVVERLSGPRKAWQIYRNALKILPDPLPSTLQPAVDRARQVVEETTDALAAFLADRAAPARARMDRTAGARFDEGLQIYAGRTRPYPSEGILLTYPRLPAIPFFDRELFPWLPELEAATDMIRGELEGMLATMDADFAPYINVPPGAPVNQWEELNQSRLWSSLFLWKDGERQEEPCRRCPGTAALLDRLPLARQPGFAPTVIFSALEARTQIPPHTGSTNTRLLVHLPLILPGPARFRVGNETRSWRMGEAWAFDDTIDHEAWNEADALRVIMILDIWNPLLTEDEREAVTALLNARNAFFSV
jgi:aspartyl/asparaginyl beta-hydroxylase (cupin superfamily)